MIRPKEHRLVGQMLASLRREAGVTQQGLARRLKRPQSFVSSFENGQRRVGVLELIRIAEALGADPKLVFRKVLSGLNHPRA